MKISWISLKQDYDYIIIDCPAGIEQGFKNAVAGADKAIVVTTPEVSSVRDADRVIGLLEKEEGMEPPRLVINRIRNHMMKNGDMMDVDDVTTHLSIDLIGIVADDDEVIKASNSGQPIALNPNSRASVAYRNIARRILGESIPLQSLETENPGVLSKLKKFFVAENKPGKFLGFFICLFLWDKATVTPHPTHSHNLDLFS